MICETLQTGRSLFAGLPELHDKMNGFFSNINFKKKNTRSYSWLGFTEMSHLKETIKRQIGMVSAGRKSPGVRYLLGII